MRRKHRRLKEEPELDITAFMNLMIVLVPILLMSMVIAHVNVLDLNFPAMESAAQDDVDELQLQVIILEDQLVVADNKGGVIKQVKDVDGKHDFQLLGRVMQEIKSRIPEKKEITIMPRQKTSYQNLVSVMDTVRSYKAVVAGSVVNAELFPEISIADAPDVIENTEEVASRLTEDLRKELNGVDS